MYISSEDEALFIAFIRNSGLAPISIKNIRSDVGHIFKWLGSQNVNVDIISLKSEYRGYLIRTQLNESTVNRRLTSLNKFAEWFTSQHHLQNAVPGSPASETAARYNAKLPVNKQFGPSIYLFMSLVLLTLALSFFFITALLGKTLFSDPKANIRTNSSPLYISFDLKFNSEKDLLIASKDPLLFNFYGDNSDEYYIGNTICTIPSHKVVNGESRLKINLGLDCGAIPDTVVEYLGSNNNIFVDILSNNVNLSSSKILITDQSYSFNKLINQNGSKDVQKDIGKSSFALPNDTTTTPLPEFFDSNSLQNSSLAQEIITLDSITGGASFSQGDVVGLYNGEFDRALLSTKVVGVVSHKVIKTSGVVEINIVQESEAIAAGDPISTSLEPGYGQKARLGSDNVFGVAVEQYATNSGKLRILLDI